MALSWWPVAVVGFACLAGALVLALLPSTRQRQRQRRPLANTARLTRLPEYARIVRARTMSMLVTIALLVLLFAAAVLAGARPTGPLWSRAEAPEDIMLCLGAPDTEPTTERFLAYFAERARAYGPERIGLTSTNRRVVPLTRDHQFAVEKLSDAAGFTAPVTYTDYAAGAADVLALCLTGFPQQPAGERRRSLIYLGPGELRAPGETRPELFTDQQVIDLARERGVQVNALVSSPGPVRDIAQATMGRYAPISPDLTDQLDGIRAHPPEADPTRVGFRGDDPTVPLAAAVFAAVALCLSLVVLRR